MAKQILIGFFAVFVACAMCGCGADKTALSGSLTDQKKSFDGGPMPPEARARMAAEQKAMAERIQKQKDLAASGKGN